MPTPVDPGRPLLVAGPGSIGRLPEVLSWWRPERVLLVGSRRAVATSSALGLLGDAAVTWYDAVRANPRWLQVAELVRLLERSRPDVVVALGGGSALDTAKLGRVLADPAPKPRPKLRKDPPRLVLVPTTGGSGAEMTRFAAVGTGRERRALDHPALLADVAIVDPRLSDSCPPAVTYPAAFDALAHAIESYWSARSTPETRALSWQATGDLVAALAAPLDTPTAPAAQPAGGRGDPGRAGGGRHPDRRGAGVRRLADRAPAGAARGGLPAHAELAAAVQLPASRRRLRGRARAGVRRRAAAGGLRGAGRARTAVRSRRPRRWPRWSGRPAGPTGSARTGSGRGRCPRSPRPGCGRPTRCTLDPARIAAARAAPRG